MIRSMTGFGRHEEIINGRDILVEIRSVNHRYYEFSARLPRAYGYLEEKLKNFLNGKISRGKTEVAVSVYSTAEADICVELNSSAAAGYVSALRKANETLGLEDDLSLSGLMRLPDIFRVTKAPDDEDAVWEDVKAAAEKALSGFISMREAEGEKIAADFSERLDTIEKLVGFIEERSPSVNEAYRERLFAKLTELLGDRNIDESRILTEAAIFADKTAVDEETVRLRSHVSQFREMMKSGVPVGRKLDFLIQEFNREANTIGSKAQDAQITGAVLELKSEIEKLREQIQNVE